MFRLCRTCGVEHAAAPLPDVCAICADDRQWVPAGGQRWATLEELAAEGVRCDVQTLEPDLLGIGATPTVGIGQLGKLICGPTGSVLWDPPGFLDDAAVAAITEHGPVVGIVASHPHMFGAQVAWSRRLGDAPVYVHAADAAWVARPDPVIETWSGTVTLTPTVSVIGVGGHFPGSAVACWSGGADGRGVLLAGDTIFPNPDRRTVGFMRSYPNHIPLSAAVVARIAATLAGLTFDRVYGLFTNRIDADAAAAIAFSAQRHIGWVRGDHDAAT